MNRLEYDTTWQKDLDCVHGLMIIHMMFYHICGSAIYETDYYYPIVHTLSFFMAWFFFKSGMLFKKRAIADVIKRGFKRFIVPALFFSIVGYLCYLLVIHPTTTFKDEIYFVYEIGAFKGIAPIWFLLSLFCVQIIYTVLMQFGIKPAYIAVFALGFLFFNKFMGFRPLWMYNIPLGLMFFSLGQFLKKLQYDKFVVIGCLIVYLGFFFVHTRIDFLYGLFKPFVIAIPWTLAGCILINVIFKSYPKLCISPLVFFRVHAMEFLCTHMIAITLIEGTVQNFDLPVSIVAFKFIAFAFYVFALSMILYYFKLKHIQWLFGRNG